MKELVSIVQLGRSIKYELPVLARLGKVTEEVGEFAETVIHHEGFLDHKVVKETPFGECADVIICSIDTLASCYPELSSERVVEHLLEMIKVKQAKWERVVITPGNKKYEDDNSRIS